MSIEQTLAANPTVLLAPNEGRHLEFLNHLATIKVAAGDGGSMSVVEFVGPRGFGPPEHRHDDDDELFIVLDGAVRFRTGDHEWDGEAGSYAYLPKAIAHTFQVLSETARFTTVTASTSGPSQFHAMVEALGTPTDRLELPEPSYVDPTEVATVNRQYGIEILGPPPAPLS